MKELRQLCVSVDMDSPALYLELWGKRVDTARQKELSLKTFQIGMLRFLELFESLGISATFFVVGKDIIHPECAPTLKQALDQGHEIASHSWSHPYNLSLMPEDDIHDELQKAHNAIEAITGQAPVGFRAPGYNTSPALLGICRQMGYTYDASPLPSWSYLLAKYGVMSALALQGRKSASIWGNPAMGFSRRLPYLDQGLIRIPCAVSRFFRLPIIGTSLVSLPRAVNRHLISQALAMPVLSLEFHAVDLMSVTQDTLPMELKQKDLLIPWQQKRQTIESILKTLQCDALSIPLKKLRLPPSS